MGTPLNGVDFDVASARCPSTTQRKQALDVDTVVPKPFVARANLAVSTEKPDGSAGSEKLRDYVRVFLSRFFTLVLGF